MFADNICTGTDLNDETKDIGSAICRKSHKLDVESVSVAGHVSSRLKSHVSKSTFHGHLDSTQSC